MMTDAGIVRTARLVLWACVPLSLAAVVLQVPAVVITSAADRVPLHTLGSLNVVPLAAVVLGVSILGAAAGALSGHGWARWVVVQALWLVGLVAGFELLFLLFLLFHFGLPSSQLLPSFLTALAWPVLVGAAALAAAAFLGSRRVAELFKSAV